MSFLTRFFFDFQEVRIFWIYVILAQFFSESLEKVELFDFDVKKARFLNTKLIWQYNP